jgi:acetyl-CoA carboxylase beta subunit
MRKSKKTWKLCPMCGLMLYATDLSLHHCHEKAMAKVDAELDMLTDELVEDFDDAAKSFWRSKDVKFIQWLVDHGRY